MYSVSYKHSSSSIGRAVFHLCFIPKYRHKIFYFPKIKRCCLKSFQKTAEKYGFRILELSFGLDHVHMLVDIGHKHSISEAVQLFKGRSSYELFRENPWLRNRSFQKGHFWSPACFYDSVGHSNFEQMMHYIKFQAH